MTLQTYVNALKSSIDIPAIDEYFRNHQDTTLEILQKVRPEGRLDGDRYKLSSVSGGQGSSFDFNTRSHTWGDWASNQGGSGLIAFLRATLKFSTAQVIDFLKENKFFSSKEVSQTLADSEGDPLVFPIPEEVSSWEYILESRLLRKDRGIITGNWQYKDTDGSLLGYKYRIDDRRTTKEIYTLTYRGESGWAKKTWSKKKKKIPAYGLHKLGESPNIRVAFVEGEKAADKAQEILGERWKVLAFSGVSAADEIWLPDNDFWTGVEVVLWPDNDKAGRDAMRKIQLKLQGMRNKPREIRIVHSDKIPGLPQKWDLGDWTEDSGIDVENYLNGAELVGSFDEICRQWVFVSQQDSFYNLEDRSLVWSVASFDRTYQKFAERSMSPSKKFLVDDQTIKVDALDFVPGAPEIIQAPNGKIFLNEWYPSEVYREAVKIANDESISDEIVAHNARFFIAHLKRICEGEEVFPEIDHATGEPVEDTDGRDLFDALATYFSQIVARPMDKRGWVPMLVSESNGTGKSYFKSLVGSILGSSRAVSITVDSYVSGYHDWKDGALFYELAETKSHDSTEVYEQIKKLHTYKPFNPIFLKDRLHNAERLNIKSKAQKIQRDFLNGYVTSNDLFPIALASSAAQDSGDRRLLVIRCENILTEEQSAELFEDEMINRAQWVGAWLLRYKTQFKWNPSWAPMTGHKRKMLEKDRERSKVIAEKSDVGKFHEFLHFLAYARKQKIGVLGRRAFTHSQIKMVCDGNMIKFPFDQEKLDSILVKLGIHRAESQADVNSVEEDVYVTDLELVKASRKQLMDELTKPLGDIL